jgi:hypothetical protein
VHSYVRITAPSESAAVMLIEMLPPVPARLMPTAGRCEVRVDLRGVGYGVERVREEILESVKRWLAADGVRSTTVDFGFRRETLSAG